MLLVMPQTGPRPRPSATPQPLSPTRRTHGPGRLVASHREGFSAKGTSSRIDLFTAMECVFDAPGAFGFTNVTDQRPTGGQPGQVSLYDTGTSGLFHFAARGQQLIEQVVQYYLTRGWDWSNTAKAPSTARQQLVADLENGKVFPGVNCPAAVAAAQAPSVPATPAVPTAPGAAAPKGQPLSPTAATLQALEADPAHFGVAWTRHLMAGKAAGSRCRADTAPGRSGGRQRLVPAPPRISQPPRPQAPRGPVRRPGPRWGPAHRACRDGRGRLRYDADTGLGRARPAEGAPAVLQRPPCPYSKG